MKHRLAITTFLFSRPTKWRQLRYESYSARHVNALWRACADNIKIPHRFVAYTERPEGIECERRPVFDRIFVPTPRGKMEDGCYPRLQLYDPQVQAELDADFILILDLDAVFVRDVTDLIDRCMRHDFSAMEGSPWRNGERCSWYNGSFQLCRAGARPQFWRDFNPQTFYAQRQSYKMPGGHRPHGTDQAWITICSGPSENTIGPADGVYQWRLLPGGVVPSDAKLLLFSGRENPWSPIVRSKNRDIADRWSQYDQPAVAAA